MFCAIVAGDEPATIVRRWDDAVAIVPHRPVTEGHILVIPTTHVQDYTSDPEVTAVVMQRAAEIAPHPSNLITSAGHEATQTVFHLHAHVVPRANGDALPLPWTPQQAAQSGRSLVTVVYAREPLPAGRSIFLAGPTPRSEEVPSWRPQAIELITEAWKGPGPLTVLTPESRGGQRAREYHDQVEWEANARDAATAILFWIPRDVKTMPAFTTNVEFGLDVRSGRAVLGCPPDCPNPERNRYLIWTAQRYGTPVTTTLAATVAAGMRVVEVSVNHA